ncbi:MAG: NUDIX domain-containing protein, partial [Opitutaceae bacterium]
SRGGIQTSEAPGAAALRELQEECYVTGRVIKLTSTFNSGPNEFQYGYWVDIGDQTPRLGDDPDKPDSKVLAEVAWLSLNDLGEMDGAYLWTGGLLAVEPFVSDLLNWNREPTAPKTRILS